MNKKALCSVALALALSAGLTAEAQATDDGTMVTSVNEEPGRGGPGKGEPGKGGKDKDDGHYPGDGHDHDGHYPGDGHDHGDEGPDHP